MVVLLVAENQRFSELKQPGAEEEEARVTLGVVVGEEVDAEVVDLEEEEEEIAVVLEADKGILKRVCKGNKGLLNTCTEHAVEFITPNYGVCVVKDLFI